jgi:hypothetical protein
MLALPEDPTSFEGLTPASMVGAKAGWAGYQRDSLSAEDKEAWDARVRSLGGQIVTRDMESSGLRAGRTMARRQTVSYYLVPELP